MVCTFYFEADKLQVQFALTGLHIQVPINLLKTGPWKHFCFSGTPQILFLEFVLNFQISHTLLIPGKWVSPESTWAD